MQVPIQYHLAIDMKNGKTNCKKRRISTNNKYQSFAYDDYDIWQRNKRK